jgi:RND family efflux transporter MFP subunit
MDEDQTRRGPAGSSTGLRRLLGLAVGALALVALGAGAAVLAMKYGWLGSATLVASTPPPATAPLASATPPTSSSAAEEVTVVLTPEAIARAAIKTGPVTSGESRRLASVPGTVMPNAYREVKVTPIAGGIVRQVRVELGSAVKRGEALATLFSPELAEAQNRFLAMAAVIDADHRRVVRTGELFEIGAASRQEMEEVAALHVGHTTDLEATRQRLLLLGLTAEQIQELRSPSQIVSTVIVPAPIDGVVTGRSANLGQVVAMGQELFVVSDLSEVWAVGDLYEQDFAAVRVGSEAAVTAPAYPGMALRGRVSYIDPRVDPTTRTAKVRVAVPNPEGKLRLGMYVSVAFATGMGERAVLVPKAAVQTLGDRQVVYLPVRDEEGKFVQRTVRLGGEAGEHYVVLSGVKPGEMVVTEGSFLLRAEAQRNAPSG